MFSHLCNGTNIFGTFHLSPHENICTIAPINIHYLYKITVIAVFSR